MESDTAARTAANESTFREINEAIERGRWPGEEAEPVGFRCECARLGCNQLVELTIADYERVRAHPRRFLLSIGHEQLNVETVIERRPGYVVVEKRGQTGALAENADPRK